jgi:hypothetical protein
VHFTLVHFLECERFSQKDGNHLSGCIAFQELCKEDQGRDLQSHIAKNMLYKSQISRVYGSIKSLGCLGEEKIKVFYWFVGS